MVPRNPMQPHGSAQPDSSHCIHEYHNWLESIQEIGKRGHLNAEDSDASFVPAQELELFFTRDRIKKTLSALFEAHPPTIPVSPDAVRKNHLKGFAILLSIGEGRYIECFVRYPDLRDQHLPFCNRPSKFPTHTGPGPNLFERFHQKQWSFCARIFKYEIDTIWEHEYILPILRKDKIGEGGSAAIYKIKLHHAHDELSTYHSPSEVAPSNVYALKTFHVRSSEQFYEKEQRNFYLLLDQVSRDRYPGLIGFYGSFRHGNSINMLLEYANGGTLEEYFREYPPPSRGVEIIDFWEGLSEVVKGLHTIHFVEQEYGEEKVMLSGYHQDITPKNILCCITDPENPYQCHFKLSDLGISNFTEKPFVRDAGGTKTYGAPECYNHDDYISKMRRNISNKTDIWSVGAIFSEAAEWTVHGHSGLQRYRQRRCEEHTNMHDFRDTGCFHDGNTLLSTVNATHEEIRSDRRLSDTITDQILSIAEEMLGRDPHARPEAAGADKRIRDMISISRTNLSHRPGVRPQGPPLKSKTMGLDEISRTRDENEPINESYHAVRAKRAISTSPVKEFSGGASSENSAPSPYFAAPQRHSPATMSQESSIYEHVDSNTLAGPRAGMAGRRTSENRNTQPRPHSANNVKAPMEAGIPAIDRSSLPLDKPRFEGLAERPKESALPADIYQSLERAQNFESEERSNIKQGTIEKRASGMTHSPSSVMEPSSTPLQSPSTLNTQPSPADIPSPPLPPNVSMHNALAWRSQIKSGSKRMPLPYEKDLKNQIGARDHVFLLDDSPSNGEHWDEVVNVLDCLGYMVKDADPDGVDIYLAHSQKKEKRCKLDKAVKFASSNRPEYSVGRDNAPSTITQSLSKILHAYHEKLTSRSKTSRLVDRLPGNSPLRPLSLYVLTDARWQPLDNIEEPILSLIKTLNSLQKPQDQVGIQFIQFGTNPTNHNSGQTWLDFLDTGLEDFAIKNRYDLGRFRDIIDTVLSTGNFWKMLLGPINPWFDRSNETAQVASSSA